MSTARDRFIEQSGLMVQAEGLPRIAGQILGYLIIEGGPRTLTQMTEALKISKASASTNARLLEHHGSARRVSALGQRQDAYEAVEEPGMQVLGDMASRFRANAETIAAIAAEFPDTEDTARARVMGSAAFYRKSAEFFDEWIARISAGGAGSDAQDESEI